MKSLGWTQLQYDRCPYKKGEIGHTDTYRGKMMCEDTGERRPSTGQGERLKMK